uniref:Tetraspanin-8 n=1 Tax=Ananas comosus var. bracteatus TaxID=296719 RepID=A0A6V7P774_ANACO|nr:unnamed protein product [Ananas comosus var. bracteatus]
MVRVSNGLLGFLNILTLVISFRWSGRALACDGAGALPPRGVVNGPAGVVLPRLVPVVGLPLRAVRPHPRHVLLRGVRVRGDQPRGRGGGVGKGYKEYRLGDYSHWLQRRVADWNTWKRIESCIGDAKLCGGLDGEVGSKANEFYKQNLSPIQSGCCKPPTYCGFVYKNATFWVAPKSGLNTRDADCKAWSNDQDKLCYGCNSCKAGVLATIKNKWKMVSIFNVALLVLLIIVYSIGCCAIRNNRADSHYKRYYGYR